MAQVGAKPKPTALKILHGTARKDRQSPHEPRPQAKAPACPPELPAKAQKEWRRISKLLLGLGLLAEIDRAALAGYCLAYARWLEAEQEVQKMGVIVKTKDGYPIVNPYLSVSRKAFEQMLKVLPEFGMTPASRSRISAIPQEAVGQESPIERMRRMAKVG